VPQVPSHPEKVAAETEGDEWGDFAVAAEEGDPDAAPTAGDPTTRFGCVGLCRLKFEEASASAILRGFA